MTMTTKELLALVDSLQESITDWGDNMRNEAMVDLLDHARRIRAALPALCAEVEAARDMMRGMIAEADRDTDPFIRARAYLAANQGEVK